MDHVGPSLLLLLWKVLMPLLERDYLKCPNKNSLIVQDHMETTDVVVDGWITPSVTLKLRVSVPNLPILTLEEINHVLDKMPLTESLVLLMLVPETVMVLHHLPLKDQYLLPSMLATGNSMVFKIFLFLGGGVFNNCAANLNHGVTLVAYDDSKWVIRNSWSSGWGESGHISLARGNTCGVCNAASAPVA